VCREDDEEEEVLLFVLLILKAEDKDTDDTMRTMIIAFCLYVRFLLYVFE
jgi:hypothetical protein